MPGTSPFLWNMRVADLIAALLFVSGRPPSDFIVTVRGGPDIDIKPMHKLNKRFSLQVIM